MDLDRLELPDEESHTNQPDTTRKPLTVKTKHLKEGDLQEHTIFDVIMPLPGFDISYPEGELGEKYRAFMKLDGLDPDDMTRERK
jgi:tRNA pseudouridine13 synthase